MPKGDPTPRCQDEADKAQVRDEPYSVGLILIGLQDNKEAVHWLERSYRGG